MYFSQLQLPIIHFFSRFVYCSFASSIVSSTFIPSVSGHIKLKKVKFLQLKLLKITYETAHAINDKVATTAPGPQIQLIGSSVSRSICGEMIPPIRAQNEQKPKPVERTDVGYISVE